MDAHGVVTKERRLEAQEWTRRVMLALVFVGIGSLIMAVFNPWRPWLEGIDDYLGRAALTALLLIAAVAARRSTRYADYAPVLLGLCILALTAMLDLVFGRYLFAYVGLNDNTPVGNGLQKLNECVVVIGTVVVCTKASGGTLRSLYLQKGNLKLGLTVGLTTFALAAAGSLPMATLLFSGEDLTAARVLPWIPWVLLFVLANGALEEVLFRGLFLQKLAQFFSPFVANLLVALVFTVIHGGATYTSDQVMFLAVTFPLALAWGYVMQKTEGVWGSILFHAGMDIPIVLGMFSNLP